MLLTDRFRAALMLAFDLHRDQERKGSGVPYVAHVLGVASLVMEHGGDEDAAISALLHDAVEDQGGLDILARIEAEFGQQVASIVLACSDSVSTPKPAWRERKEAYIAHLRQAGPDAQLVSACDKLYNLRTILADYARSGEALWSRFTGGRDGVLWYYGALANEAFTLSNAVVDALRDAEAGQSVEGIPAPNSRRWAELSRAR
jgi:(p)ppGpp synthase/HD superfamily hydrolase